MSFTQAKKLRVGDKVVFCDGVKGEVVAVHHGEHQGYPHWFEVRWEDQGIGAIDCHDARLIERL